MKALTVRQPHAQLIALGVKTIETRSRTTKHRGPLLIHAGTHPVPQRDGNAVWHEASKDWVPFRYGVLLASCNLVDDLPILRSGMEPETPGDYIENYKGLTGFRLWHLRLRVDGSIDTINCVEEQRRYGDFTPGRRAWLLRDALAVDEPVPAKGKQGLWEWTP